MNVKKELIEEILELKPQDKIFLIEALVESLDKPDKYIQEVWLKEAQDRLNAQNEGHTSRKCPRRGYMNVIFDKLATEEFNDAVEYYEFQVED